MKDEAYWTRWLTEHDLDGMTAEVLDLADEIHAAQAAGWSDERIVKAGRRQAQLVHLLLEFYSVGELAEETGMSSPDLIGLHSNHLATRADGAMVRSTWN